MPPARQASMSDSRRRPSIACFPHPPAGPPRRRLVVAASISSRGSRELRLGDHPCGSGQGRDPLAGDQSNRGHGRSHSHRSAHGRLGPAAAERKRYAGGLREAGSPRLRDNLAPMIRRAFRLSVVLVPLALAACATQATPPPPTPVAAPTPVEP